MLHAFALRFPLRFAAVSLKYLSSSLWIGLCRRQTMNTAYLIIQGPNAPKRTTLRAPHIARRRAAYSVELELKHCCTYLLLRCLCAHRTALAHIQSASAPTSIAAHAASLLLSFRVHKYLAGKWLSGCINMELRATRCGAWCPLERKHPDT